MKYKSCVDCIMSKSPSQEKNKAANRIWSPLTLLRLIRPNPNPKASKGIRKGLEYGAKDGLIKIQSKWVIPTAIKGQ